MPRSPALNVGLVSFGTKPREGLALTFQPSSSLRCVVGKGLDYGVADLILRVADLFLSVADCILNMPTLMSTHREERHDRATVVAPVRIGT